MFCFHVLWEELHFPRADCPAQSVVVRLRVREREREREKGGSTTGGTSLGGLHWALEETRIQRFYGFKLGRIKVPRQKSPADTSCGRFLSF